MLKQLEDVKTKWGGKSQTVDNWLNARQQLLINFCNLAGMDKRNETLPEANEIAHFCECLMDYLSAGHFEVFDILVSDDADGQQLKAHLYPKLTQTTDAALQFNDKFAEAVTTEQAANFDDALAKLGETLEERFGLEDKLIEHMHTTPTRAAHEVRPTQ
jgi:regulator of sigma D